MKKYIFLTFLLLLSFVLKSQNKIDSIDNTLKSLDNFEKVKKLNKIYLYYKFNEPNLSVKIAKLAFYYAKKTNNDTILIKPLINISLAYYYSTEYDSVLTYLDKAEKKCKKNNYEEAENIILYLAQITNIRGIIEYRFANYEKAIEYYLESEKLYTSINDSSGLAKIYNNIAVMYRKIEDFYNAKDYYLKSIKLHKKRNDSTNLGISYNNVAILYSKDRLDKPDSLLFYTNKSMDINKKINNLRILSINYHTLANHYIRAKQYDRAIKYGKKSIKIKKTTQNTSGLAYSYNLLADIYLKKDNIILAEKYIDSSYNISKKIDDNDILKENYKVFYQIDSIRGNYKSAFFNLYKYSQLKDTLYREKVSKKINKLEKKYLREKKNKEIKLRDLELAKNKEKIKKQQVTIFAFIAGFIIILVSVFLIYLQNKKIKNANKKLKEKNIEINQQKEEIISQRDEIISQRDEIIRKSQKIESQNKHIKSSINYAAKIQKALITQNEIFNKLLPDNFIFFKPRDIVSGDFYWAKKIDNTNKVAFAVADCTGHGVPGAFMSVLGISFLNEILNNLISNNNLKNITSAIILNKLRNKIKIVLHQKDEKSVTKDGMDMIMCIIDFNKNELQFAGANNPVYIIRDNKLTELKADRMPIGISFSKKRDFKNHKFKLKKNDIIYGFSDGFYDQFGGKKNQKYFKSNFKKFLLSIQNLSLQDQKKALNKEFNTWMAGKYEQIDDVIVLGVKI